MDSERNREHEGATDRGSSNVGGGAPGMRELRMEDYGHDDSDPTLTGVEGPATTAGQPEEAQHSNVGGAQSGHSGQSGGSDVEEQAGRGGYSGGTEGMHEGGHQGEMFGEFDNTGTGTDLTVEFDEAGEGERTEGGQVRG